MTSELLPLGFARIILWAAALSLFAIFLQVGGNRAKWIPMVLCFDATIKKSAPGGRESAQNNVCAFMPCRIIYFKMKVTFEFFVCPPISLFLRQFLQPTSFSF